MPRGRSRRSPQLSAYSFSSASETSPYHNAYWLTTATGPAHAPCALGLGPAAQCGDADALRAHQRGRRDHPAAAPRVTNTGSGHKFPSGFPEGRNAWVALRAFDLATGTELEIADAVWHRTSVGVGYLTATAMVDPNFPGCNWVIPAGSTDPYAWQLKAVASLGDGCPTLALPYATPLNLVVNADGMPIDAHGTVIDRANPLGQPAVSRPRWRRRPVR